ncbi:hypothetical protein HMPREF9622_02447 [Cutibacterium modestum HL037PA3]|uniref:Uncharacterized protein n=1 Tax=Cutibacterium modestum HL044PA1 TaxID=765109 RepID=A0ABP2KCD5_9ACTN|nr:hypothetical protein HMPREF9607_01398 [Cutibacterium modestum HL044PA1]EFT14511.1 hypothetical protein HMPREF9622_02447 [Cutibacterium modestum HL037PA3]
MKDWCLVSHHSTSVNHECAMKLWRMPRLATHGAFYPFNRGTALRKGF